MDAPNATSSLPKPDNNSNAPVTVNLMPCDFLVYRFRPIYNSTFKNPICVSLNAQHKIAYFTNEYIEVGELYQIRGTNMYYTHNYTKIKFVVDQILAYICALFGLLHIKIRTVTLIPLTASWGAFNPETGKVSKLYHIVHGRLTTIPITENPKFGDFYMGSESTHLLEFPE